MTRLEDKNRAIELRRQGRSYKEIQTEVSVSKGLLSGWLQGISLTAEEKTRLEVRLKERKEKGRMISLISNRTRAIERERRAEKEASVIFKKLKNNPLFLLGVSLYWVGGAKHTNTFQFTNVDPDMIFLMHAWIQKFLHVPKEQIGVRIFAQDKISYDNACIFWSKNLNIEPYSIQKTLYGTSQQGVKRNPHHKGCVRLTVYQIHTIRLMKAWQKLYMQYYGEALTRP